MFVRRSWRKKSWSFWTQGVFLALLLLTLSLRTALRLTSDEQRRRQHDDSLAWIMAQVSWHDQQKSLVLLPSWPANRSQRFPSIAQRVRFYLGPAWSHLLLGDDDNGDCNQTLSTYKQQRWMYDYQRNGSVVVLSLLQQVVLNHNDNGNLNVRTASAGPAASSANFTISNEAAMGIQQAIFVYAPKIQACADSPHKPTRYCKDVLKTVIPAAAMTNNHTHNDNDAPPILIRFGDVLQPHTPYPLFQKFRPALPIKKRNCDNTNDPASSFQWPMIWKLNTERHYAMLDQVASRDIYWQYKKNQAMFRGDLSGWHVPAHDVARDSNNDDVMTKRCQQSTRCRFVYDHFEDPLIDAKLIALRPGLNATFNGRTIKGHRKSLAEMLRYKGLIVLEGNDVASGLKWSLLSRSVVLMPVPTKSSWAMEESLEPWIHYVPLAADGHDAHTQMQWVLDHDAEAQRIAHGGSLWIQDLMASDADSAIFQMLLLAYRRAFSVPSSPS
eukprot:scaffold220_cov169-Amphora_coffeaeformis.AAC.5